MEENTDEKVFVQQDGPYAARSRRALFGDQAGAGDFAASSEMVSPRYAGIKRFTADLTIESSGRASCQVIADLYETYTGKITMYLINQSSGGQTVKS